MPLRPKSRLDMLPVGVLRTVFAQAFQSVAEDDIHEANRIREEGRQRPVLRKEHAKRKTLLGMHNDPLNSALVRSVALEEMHRDTCLEVEVAGRQNSRSIRQVMEARTATLQADPSLGRCVQRLTLVDGQRLTDVTGGVVDPRERKRQRSKHERKQHDERLARLAEMFESMSTKAEWKHIDWGGVSSTPSIPYPRCISRSGEAPTKPQLWAEKTARILDLLETMPGLQELAWTAPELALLPAEAAGDGLRLPRLRTMRIRESVVDLCAQSVLNMDNALFHAAPGLTALFVKKVRHILSTAEHRQTGKEKEKVKALPSLTTLQVGTYSYLSAASIETLFGAIGPQLANVSVQVLRQTCLPSADDDLVTPECQQEQRAASFYDVLAALEPWKASTLRVLDVRRESYRTTGIYDDQWNHLIEDAERPKGDGQSSTALLAGFTALRRLIAPIDLLDWRTAYDNDPSAIRRAADSIVANLPPNIEYIEIHAALGEERLFEQFQHPQTFVGRAAQAGHQIEDPPAHVWWPRRQALARSLIAATRAGRFPNLGLIRLLPTEGDWAKYTVADKRDAWAKRGKVIGAGAFRLVYLSAFCAPQLVVADADNVPMVTPSPGRRRYGVDMSMSRNRAGILRQPCHNPHLGMFQFDATELDMLLFKKTSG